MKGVINMLIFCNVLLLCLMQPVVTNTVQNFTMCGSKKCFHNALCSYDGLSCQCHRGYKGDTCQDDFNECEFGNPCFHRGHCENTFGSWRCHCLQGWTNGGMEHCETKTNQSIRFRKCLPGWMGDFCQDECLTNGDCTKHQSCKRRGRGFHCLCLDGWNGPNCTSDIDECTRNPCANYENCMNTDGSYRCTCPSGWQGINCSVDVDECLINPCKHSGLCVNTAGSYMCNCTTGWKGIHCNDSVVKGCQRNNCSVDVDECLVNPCKHSGLCVSTAGSYVCNCTTGWKGIHCNDSDVKVTDDFLSYETLIIAVPLASFTFLIGVIVAVVVAKKQCRKRQGNTTRTRVVQVNPTDD